MNISFKRLLEHEINRNILIALKEDIGKGDLTSSFIEKNSLSTAKIFCNENAIFCGKAWLDKIIKKQKSLEIKWQVKTFLVSYANSGGAFAWQFITSLTRSGLNFPAGRQELTAVSLLSTRGKLGFGGSPVVCVY